MTQEAGKRKWMILVLKILVVCVIFTVISMKIDFREMASEIKHASVTPVLLAFLLFLLNRVLAAVKWNMLLRHNGIRAGLLNLVRIMFVSGFLGIMIPSGLGVDIIRLIQVGREKRNLTASTGSVLADRMLAVMALSCLSVIAAILSWGLVEEKKVLATVLVLGGILILLMLGVMGSKSDMARALPDRIRNKVEEIHGSFAGLLRKPAVFMAVFALNLLVQFLRVAQIHLLFRAMGTQVPVIFEVTFVPMIILLTLLPVSPFMGIGVKEGAFLYFFSKVNVSPEVAVSVSLLSHAVVIAGLIPGAILFFCRKREK